MGGGAPLSWARTSGDALPPPPCAQGATLLVSPPRGCDAVVALVATQQCGGVVDVMGPGGGGPVGRNGGGGRAGGGRGSGAGGGGRDGGRGSGCGRPGGEDGASGGGWQ